MARSELTDEQGMVIEQLMPCRKGEPGARGEVKGTKRWDDRPEDLALIYTLPAMPLHKRQVEGQADDLSQIRQIPDRCVRTALEESPIAKKKVSVGRAAARPTGSTRFEDSSFALAGGATN
jgi:hypothetical protein